MIKVWKRKKLNGPTSILPIFENVTQVLSEKCLNLVMILSCAFIYTESFPLCLGCVRAQRIGFFVAINYIENVKMREIRSAETT